MAKILNVGTKQANGYISAYNRAWQTDLSDCYENWSVYKQRAFNYCKDVQRELDGWDFRITGHNCNFFTVAFRFERDGEDWLHIETHANTYETRYC